MITTINISLFNNNLLRMRLISIINYMLKLYNKDQVVKLESLVQIQSMSLIPHKIILTVMTENTQHIAVVETQDVSEFLVVGCMVLI